MTLALLASTSFFASVAPIDIDVGRQLFVDNAFIASSTGLVRHWTAPTKCPDPLVWPGAGAAPKSVDGSSRARQGDPVNLTCATDGGLWWDPHRRVFRLWYQADWLGDICYAESADGTSWRYPDCGVVKGTNRIFEKDVIDSWTVTPDYAAPDPYASWCLYVSEPGGQTDDKLWRSSDGVHFAPLGTAGQSGDRSTCYYDPFRRVWVFSLRDFRPKDGGRCRSYYASTEFGGSNCHWQWKGKGARKTGGAAPEDWLNATNGLRRSLYSFNAVAYESLMLGVMEILYNTPRDNSDCEKVGLPKQTGLHFCFSRDGKTFSTPRYDADIGPSGWGTGTWDTGYLSCVGGICVIRDERLWFYYSALRGDGTRTGEKEWSRNGMYSNGAIGVATLRRDGFAGMVADGRGELVTPLVRFGGSHLFVNAECRFGSLSAEILDEKGVPLSGFAAADCTPIAHADKTKAELAFRGGDLSALAGRAVRFRFRLHCGTLYSFWVSPSTRGESLGYVAAGGPAYRGLRDM